MDEEVAGENHEARGSTVGLDEEDVFRCHFEVYCLNYR